MLVEIFLFVFVFLKQKIYVLIHIYTFDLCRRVFNKKISPSRFPKTRLLFFGLLKSFRCVLFLHRCCQRICLMCYSWELVNTGINLLTTIGDLTSTELKSKDNIIHKLINKSNCEENTNRISMNQSSTKITSNNTQDINVSDKNNDVNAIKEQVATIKENSR